MVDVVIGLGEVGLALHQVLGERRDVRGHDPPKRIISSPEFGFEWMHVAYPWREDFVETTLKYVAEFSPAFLVVHSTVPVGTTREIDVAADTFTFSDTVIFYSPVRGIHPHISRYLREFPKWWAGANQGAAIEELFASCGMQARRAPSYEALEYMKLLETTEYFNRIALWQEIERQVAKYELRGGAEPLETLTAVKEWLFEKRKVYDGDRGLAPIMRGGVVGGHCLVPNLELLRLSGAVSAPLYRWLKESNEMRKEELDG